MPEIRIIDPELNFLANIDAKPSEIQGDTLFTSQIMLITVFEGSSSGSIATPSMIDILQLVQPQTLPKDGEPMNDL